MKKGVALVLIMALICLLNAPAAWASPEDMKGQVFRDFSAKTIDGATFTLSESLKTHDLVLINFWATWCGPCRMEFPYLETAWEQYADRVDVIALSVEGSDTMSTLKSFAKESGLNFMIGRDENGLFDSMNGTAIPTTLIVDKDRRVVAVEIGSKSSVADFTALFDALLPAAPSQSQAVSDRCVLCFCDAAGNPIPGVTVAFCNGEYEPVQTDQNGRVTFDGKPSDYHVHLLEVPYGYSKPWEQLYIDGEEYTLTVTLYR